MDERNSAEIRYAAWLLRVWHEDESSQPRVTLKDVRNGVQHNFISFERLVDFLTAKADVEVEQVEGSKR